MSTEFETRVRRAKTSPKSSAGSFASKTNAETAEPLACEEVGDAGTLDGPSAPATSDPDVARRVPVPWTDPDDVEHLERLTRVIDSVAEFRYSHHDGVQVSEDVASAAKEQILLAAAVPNPRIHGSVAVPDGKNHVREYSPAYARSVVRGVWNQLRAEKDTGAALTSGAKISKSRLAAQRALDAKKREHFETYHREMTSVEVERAAYEVMAAIPDARNRPSAKSRWWEGSKVSSGVSGSLVTSLDDEGGDERKAYAQGNYAASAEETWLQESDYAWAEALGESGVKRAATMMWAAVAARAGLDVDPHAEVFSEDSASGRVTGTQMRDMLVPRASVNDRHTNDDAHQQAVVTLARDFESMDPEKVTRAAAMLEAIFGTHSETDMHKVADVVLSNPAGAWLLVDTAITARTKVRQRKAA